MSHYKIAFEIKDQINANKLDAIKKAFPLFQYIVENIHYLDYLCDGILIHNSYKKFESSFDEWVSKLPGSNIDEKLFQEMRAFYVRCRRSHELLSNARGSLLEQIIYRLVYPRFQYPPKIISRGCCVLINGKAVKTDDRQTVDIAGWDGEYGEFIETKVSPEVFDGEVLRYLKVLSHALITYKCRHALVCVSMERRSTLIYKIKKKCRKIEVDYDLFYYVGRNEIGNMSVHVFK